MHSVIDRVMLMMETNLDMPIELIDYVLMTERTSYVLVWRLIYVVRRRLAFACIDGINYYPSLNLGPLIRIDNQ